MGGVALIRVSGSVAKETVEKFLRLSIEKPRHAYFAVWKNEDGNLDEVLCTYFKGPSSFTGEDVVEIACHGSVFIQEQILNDLATSGIQIAQPGEFTMRAYLNKKMDLSQAEGVMDLISSRSQMAHKIAMKQMKGGLSNEIHTLRDKLLHFASMIELELDFAEEDVEFADRSQLKELLLDIHQYLTKLHSSFKTGNALKNGVPVAIVGRPNAGKSTLLNTLLNEDRAIVSNIPGTTRDTVEERFFIDGIEFRLMDTAGIRETEDEIEKAGIERSLSKITEAQIVIYIYDITQITEGELNSDLEMIRAKNEELLAVSNKSDLHERNSDHLSISAKKRTGISELENELRERASSHLDLNQTIITNTRHAQLLSLALEELNKVKMGLDHEVPSDLVAMDIRAVIRNLSEITGDISTDELLGNIFSRFCIGK
jgi:tRNA modification GTPase